MKILYHHRTASKDGQRVHIDELVAALRARGHEVVMVEPPLSQEVEFGGKLGGLDSVRRHLPKVVYELLEIAYNIPAYLRLRRAFLTHKPDVLYERHNLYLLAGAWLKRRFGIRYLLEVNSPIFRERSAHGGLVMKAFARRSEAWVWRQADLVLPVTAVLARTVADEGVDPRRVAVIHNGIDPQRFNDYPSIRAAKERLGLEAWTVLGFTGFVREWNALERVIDLLARPGNERLFLLVVGDGPARESLQQHARLRGVQSRVRILGIVPRDEVRNYVAAFDIALLPAVNPYASPLKLFEYMVLGRAIVAPAQPNILEVVSDGRSALLFDDSGGNDLPSVVSRLTSSDDLRLSLGRAAKRAIASRDFTWDGNARRIAQLVQGESAGAPADAASPHGALRDSEVDQMSAPGDTDHPAKGRALV